MEQLIQIASEYGLFVALVVYVLWENRQRETRNSEREDKYVGVISTLNGDISNKLSAVKDVVDDTKEHVLQIETKLAGHRVKGV